MKTHELKDALTLLAKEDPEFMQDLIGEVIKSNLVIDSQKEAHYDCYYYALKWKQGENSASEFSRSY